MKEKLPQDIIAKAVKQKDRIIEAPNKLLDAALQMDYQKGPPTNPRKRDRDPGYEESTPKTRRTENVDASYACHVLEVNSVNETSSLGLYSHAVFLALMLRIQ